MVLSGLTGFLLYQAIEAADLPDTQAFRLQRWDGGYSLEVDDVHRDDCVASFKGRAVLAVDPRLKDELDPVRVDAHLLNDDTPLIVLRNETADNGQKVVQVALGPPLC